MAGIADIVPLAVFQGAGSRVLGDFADGEAGIPFASNGHLFAVRIDADGNEEEQELGVHFDLDVTLDSSTGLYTCEVELRGDQDVLAAGERWAIWREQPLDQSLAIEYSSSMPSRSFDRLHNKIIAIAQEERLQRNRAIRVPIFEDGVELVPAEQRKGKVLAGNPNTGALSMATIASLTGGDGQALVQEFNFEATADQDTFTLTNTRANVAAAVLVWVGGARQPSSSYTLTLNGDDSDLVLADGVAAGVDVDVLVLGSIGTTDVGVSGVMEDVVQADTLAGGRTALGAAGLGDANVFTQPQTVRGRVNIPAGYLPFNLAAAVLAAGIYFNQDALVTIGASKELDLLRHDDTITVGANGVYHFANHNITTDTATSASANIRGYVSNLLAGGAGTYTNAYLRSELATAGYAADLFNLKEAIKTRSGAGNVYNRQVANDTDAGGQMDAIEWVSSQTASAALTDYTYLSDTKNSVAVAHIQYSAVGNGDFLTEKNSTASADLFRVDKLGVVFALNGIELGHLSDTTIARSSAGNPAVEGNLLYRQGGTDVALADGGTGASTQAGAQSALGVGFVFISTQDASASATIDFTTLDDAYDSYLLVITSAKPATDDVEAWLRVQTGGASWQTSGYEYGLLQYNRGGGAPTGIAGSAASHIKLSPASGAGLGCGNGSGKSFSAQIEFQDPEASQFCHFNFRTTNNRSIDNTLNKCDGGGQYSTSGAITGIRFMFSSGNIASGRFTLYGRRKS